MPIFAHVMLGFLVISLNSPHRTRQPCTIALLVSFS
jgi:hypothetical protein